MDIQDFMGLGKTYLQSNAKGFYNGTLKAEMHKKLCELFVSKRLGIELLVARHIKVEDQYLVSLVRRSTLELTDYLDERINFPLDKAPNYKKLTPLFIEEFIRLATDWFDDQVGLMSDQELQELMLIVTQNHLGYAYPALVSYGFEYVAGESNEDKDRFLTMKSLLGQEVTVKPNQYFGCKFTLKGLER